MKEGWILLHRKIQDNDIWTDKEPFDKRSAWIDLLLMANHTDRKIIVDYKLVEVKRGQIYTSVRKLAKRWGWSKDKTLKYLLILESLQMIVKNSDTKRTLLTIENYDFYQSVQDTDKTRTRHGQDTASPQTNNYKRIIKNDKKKDWFRSGNERVYDYTTLMKGADNV